MFVLLIYILKYTYWYDVHSSPIFFHLIVIAIALQFVVKWNHRHRTKTQQATILNKSFQKKLNNKCQNEGNTYTPT